MYAKKLLILQELAAASAADHGSIKKIESRTTSVEDSGLLRKNVTKIIANKTK